MFLEIFYVVALESVSETNKVSVAHLTTLLRQLLGFARYVGSELTDSYATES